MTINNIFVAGGGGYVGSALVPKLLANGFRVTVYDLMIYGTDVLTQDPNLKVVRGDVRDLALLKSSLNGADAVIHLACISNDPSFELNPALGKSINYDCFEPFVKCSRDAGVKRFLYASSSSVYGIKEEENVHEEMRLEPLTDYSIYKAKCEDILQKCNTKDFNTVVLRPATVCGYSKRQRLDVVVNILTNLAYHKNEITIFGGSQLRPNIHINDMTRAYIHILEAPRELINGEVFNVGFENKSVAVIAKTVKNLIGDQVQLIQKDTNDLRSYHVSSEKIRQVLGFKPKSTVKDAILDLKKVFDAKLLVNPLENELFFNIKRMKRYQLELLSK